MRMLFIDEPLVKRKSETAFFLGLFPAELVVLSFAGLALILYSHFGIALRDPAALYFQRVRGLLAYYSSGLILALLFIRLAHIRAGRKIKQIPPKRVTWLSFHEKYLSWSMFLRDLRLLNALTIMFVVYVNLKHLIPLVNPTVYDEPLLRFDRWLFSGHTSTEALQGLFGTDVGMVTGLSFGYTAFYMYTALSIYIIVLQRKVEIAQEFCTAFALMWFLGILTVYAFPTWGPCFYLPDSVSSLPPSEVSGMQERLWRLRLHLASVPDSPSGLFLISGPFSHLWTSQPAPRCRSPRKFLLL